MKIEMSVALLSAVVRWTRNDGNNKHLAQVVVRDGELIACDGHRLVRVSIRAPSTFSFGMDRFNVTELVTVARTLGVERIGVDIGSKSEIVVDVGRATYRCPYGPLKDFPSSRKLNGVGPDGRALTKAPPGVGVNPTFLADIAGVQLAIGGSDVGVDDGHHAVRLVAWGGLRDAVEFRSTGDDVVRYILMPVQL